MKRYILGIIFFILSLFVVEVAIAQPFLVADKSTDGATVWKLEIDGAETEVFIGDTVHYDLSTLSPGAHIIKGAYGKEWTADASEGGPSYEWSEWSVPFGLTKPGDSHAPLSIKLRFN